jgi:hypothetical protein
MTGTILTMVEVGTPPGKLRLFLVTTVYRGEVQPNDPPISHRPQVKSWRRGSPILHRINKGDGNGVLDGRFE